MIYMNGKLEQQCSGSSGVKVVLNDDKVFVKCSDILLLRQTTTHD